MRLNAHAAAALQELADAGITDVTPDEIVVLHECGKALDTVVEKGNLPGRGLPVEVGNALLWPMTCAGADWWKCASEWFANSGGALLAVVWGYALAHGREPDKLPYSRKEATKRLQAWFRGLNVTLDELDEACGIVEELRAESYEDAACFALAGLISWKPAAREKLLEMFPELDRSEGSERRERTQRYWRSMCAEMAAIFGGSIDEWYLESKREAVRCYALGMSAVAMRAGGGGDQDKQKSAKNKALKALREEIAAVMKRRGNG